MCSEIYGNEVIERCIDTAPSNYKLMVGEDNSSSAGASESSQGALLAVESIKTVYILYI